MERDRNRQQVWWAVLASIVLHALIGLSLAAFGGRYPEISEQETQVPQLTIVEAPEPTPLPLVETKVPTTTVERKSDRRPRQKDFEANEDSVAAAEQAATEKNVLPGQDGKDRPFTNLEEHDYSLGRGAQPQPRSTPAPAPTPNESPIPAAAPTPVDQLALLTQTPTPVPTPDAAYRDLQQKTIIRGGINNRGRSAVNAVGTPQGRYKKLLEDAIGSRWYYYVSAKADLVSIGTTSVTFDILSDGTIKDLR